MNLSNSLSAALYCSLLLILLSTGFTVPSKEEHWQALFNGRDLSGWDTYLGPALRNDGKPVTEKPQGLNNDPQKVFTVVRLQDENVIRISGQSWGAITSKKEYKNYHLQLQFKWGELTWAPRKNQAKDSGLLYHCVGSHGADASAWMRSQEFQIAEKDCGDYWGVAGGSADIPAIKRSEGNYTYDPQGTLTTFREDRKESRHCAKKGNAENPAGEWNTLDLYCHGDTSIHVVNGKVMMVLYNNKQIDKGEATTLDKGKIQIQSEGAEVFYKKIRIRSITQLPAELLKQRSEP